MADEKLTVKRTGLTLSMLDGTSRMLKEGDEVPLDQLSESQRKMVEDKSDWLFPSNQDSEAEDLVEVSSSKSSSSRKSSSS
jgi:hypothetical protein